MKKILLLFFACLYAGAGFSQEKAPEEVLQVSVGPDTPEVSDKGFEIYPNPSDGVIHLSLSGFENKKPEIKISNVIGNLVYREVLQELESKSVKVIDLSQLAKGVYYIKLEVEDYSVVRKVILK